VRDLLKSQLDEQKIALAYNNVALTYVHEGNYLKARAWLSILPNDKKSIFNLGKISDDVKNAIINRIKREGRMKEVELICVVRENIIGGFILEGNGKRIDASVAYDLTKIKNRFSTNEFIYRFR
jgi:hypothetical protein